MFTDTTHPRNRLQRYNFFFNWQNFSFKTMFFFIPSHSAAPKANSATSLLPTQPPVTFPLPPRIPTPPSLLPHYFSHTGWEKYPIRNEERSNLHLPIETTLFSKMKEKTYICIMKRLLGSSILL